MPRQQRAHGRPGTPVIPRGWQTSHAPVVAATLPSRVTIGTPSGPSTWDQVSKRTVATPGVPVYADGPARLNLLGNTERRVDVAAEALDVAQYAVTLDRSHPGADAVAIGHRIVVHGAAPGQPIAPDDDPALWEHVLWVVQIAHDGHRFSRQITARLDV